MNHKTYRLIFLYFSLLLMTTFNVWCQKVAVVKYNGGGDWYANPTALPNLIAFTNKHINTAIDVNPETVAIESIDIMNYPIVFLTGHGNILLSEQAQINLKKYLTAGGFLHISDNYGLDSYIRREMKKVFPNLKFEEIPFNHPVYHQNFTFDKGVPKIHEHDNKPAQGFGLFIDDRLVCFYDYECDLSDGWEDAEVHNNDAPTREKALKMGSNILEYAFTN